MASNDPEFETKAADIIGLYLNPPQHTPTYSSWLNQVEIWFAKIERDVIARGVFTSIADLRRKLMKYIRAYAQRAQPIWTYTDPKCRITTKSITGTPH
jgi:hypothetical protein